MRNRPIPRPARWSESILLALVAGAASAESTPSCQPLASGTSLKLPLSEITQPRLLRVEQRGVDVEIRALGRGGEVIWRVDSPRDRQGEESALVEGEPGPPRLELFARERGAPAGEVCWSFEPVPAARLVVERELTAAGRSYALGTREGWLAARGAYERALMELRQAGDQIYVY